MRLLKTIKTIDEWLGKIGSWFEKRGLVRLLKSLEAVAILVVIITFFFDLEDRKLDRYTRAWSLITSEANATETVNTGLINPLEMLNKDGKSLARIQLGNAWLEGISLKNANLSEANLEGANLRGAKLSQSDLSFANLSKADLTNADLSGANLAVADLSGALLTGADLTGADIAEADFRETKGLTQPQIDSACESSDHGQIIYLPNGFRPPSHCFLGR